MLLAMLSGHVYMNDENHHDQPNAIRNSGVSFIGQVGSILILQSQNNP